MNLLGVVAGGNFRKSICNPTIMMRREISQREIAITQNIHACLPWNPRCTDSRQLMDRVQKRKHLRHDQDRNGGTSNSPSGFRPARVKKLNQ
jgi:hypothetical protein